MELSQLAPNLRGLPMPAQYDIRVSPGLGQTPWGRGPTKRSAGAQPAPLGAQGLLDRLAPSMPDGPISPEMLLEAGYQPKQVAVPGEDRGPLERGGRLPRLAPEDLTQLSQDELRERYQSVLPTLEDTFGGYSSYLPNGQAQPVVDSLRAAEDEQADLLSQKVGQQIGLARQRAQATEAQLRDAGMLQLANQFKTANRNIAFDTARRGTLGGSRSIERSQQAELARSAGASQVALDAARAGADQFRRDVNPLLSFERQALSGGFGDAANQFQLEDLQNLASGAQGQFNIDQTRQNIQRGADQARAGAIYGGLNSIAQGIRYGGR